MSGFKNWIITLLLILRDIWIFFQSAHFFKALSMNIHYIILNFFLSALGLLSGYKKTHEIN